MISVLTLYDFHAPQSTECISTRLFLASCIHSHQSMHLYYGIELYLAPHCVIMTSLPPFSALICFLPPYVFCPCMFSAPICFFVIYVFFLLIFCFCAAIFHHPGLNHSTTTNHSTYDLCALLYTYCVHAHCPVLQARRVWDYAPTSRDVGWTQNIYNYKYDYKPPFLHTRNYISMII